MIYLSEDERKKVMLLDELFRALSAADIKEIIGSDLIVGRLKGTETMGPGRLSELFGEFMSLQHDLVMEQTNIINLKDDFHTLLRCLNKGMGDAPAANEFYNLKSKYGIF